MRSELILGGLAGAALIAACAQAGMGGASSPRREANARALEEAKPVGDPVSCLQLISIRETRVRSDNVIDFIMRDGRVYRNTLPQGCPSLGFEERFTYRTSIGRLCSLDTVTVLQSGSNIRGPTCGLGPFQPIELPK